MAEQEKTLAQIVAQHTPSLSEMERSKLIEQLEAFITSAAEQGAASSESWIPVTSRYPAPGERVLIFIPRWGTLTIGWVSKNDASRWEMITMPGKSTDLVSHWYPLPAGPLARP